MSLHTNCIISKTHFWCLLCEQLVKLEFANFTFSTGYHVIDGQRYRVGQAIDVVTRRRSWLIEIQESITNAIAN